MTRLLIATFGILLFSASALSQVPVADANRPLPLADANRAAPIAEAAPQALPWSASLLLIRADWSQSPAAKQIAGELREALQGLNVPQESLDKLPASAVEILFPPRIGAIYAADHFPQFMAWLKAKELMRESLAFEMTFDNVRLPSGLYRTRGIGTRALPYDFFDLPPLNVENNQPFFKWEIGFQWTARFGFSQSQQLSVEREFAILETARGEKGPRVKEQLDSRTFVLPNLTPGELIVFNPLEESLLREAARRKGFEALVVVQRGDVPTAGVAPRLALPDRVATLEVQGDRAFPFRQGGTLLVDQNGRHRWKKDPKAAEEAATEQPAANPDLEIKKREIEEQYKAAQTKLNDIAQQLTNPNLDLSAQEQARLKSEAAQLQRQIDSKNRQELGLINEPQTLQGAGAARREGATETKSGETQIKVFSLRNVRAVDVERTVNQLFGREIHSAAADERSNSLIVRGSPDDLNVIFAILTRLDEYSNHQPPPAAGAMGSADAGGLPTAASSANAARQYEAKEQQAAALALQIRELQSGGKGDQAKLDKLTADLRKAVGEAFAARQQLHQSELAQLQQRMSGIRQSLTTRDSLKDKIIDRRVKDLLDPNLQWEAGSPGLRTADRSANWRSPAQNAAAQAARDKLRDRWKQVQTLYENGRVALTEELQAAKDLNEAEIIAASTENESRDARQAALARLKQIQAIVDAKVAQGAEPEFHKLTVDAEVLKAEQQSTDDGPTIRFNDRAQLFARLQDDRKWVENANDDITRATTPEQRRSAREVKLSWLRDIVIVLLRLRQSGEVSEKVLAAAEAEMQQAEAELTADYASSVPGESSQKSPAIETAATSLVPPPGGNLRGDISAMIWTVLGVSVTVVEGEELKKAGLPRGLLVEKVRPDGPTQMLREGDIIVGVHRWATDSVPTLAWCILQPIARGVAVVEPTTRSTAETVKLHLLRGGAIERVDVELQPWAPGPRPSRSAPSWVGQGSSNAATNANVPVTAGKTTTLLGPSEFRERLIEQEQRLAKWKGEDATKFSGNSEANKKLIEEATQRAERELNFLREEFTAQLRLLELEMQDAAAAVATAQQMQKIAQEQEGVARGKMTQGNLLVSERAVQEANLRFHRAKTLLELYRKADPKDSAAEAGEAPVESKPR